MSMLNLPSPSTAIHAGFFPVNALAKRDQSRKKQRFNTSTKRDPGTDSDQLKKESLGFRVAPSKEGKGSVSDVAVEPSRTALESIKQAIVVEDGADEIETDDNKLLVADRSAVLKAFIGTSLGLSLTAILLRQVSHSGAENGWLNFPDITTLMPFRPELWHAVPTVGVVVLVASLRQALLQVWQDFAESSQVANKQVLTSLEAVDLLTISFLSGISEEFLFRGALLPFWGPDWKGVVGAGLLFGVLHVSGGRNASFAIWASFVGVVYGILGLYTCDLAAPMAAHSLANLLGGAIWKVSQNDEESKSV
ncbi:unnamed protein product [Calypogeia fissa]